MATFRATRLVTLAIPDRLKANGKPPAHAVWRNVPIPSGSLVSTATPYIVTLCRAVPDLVPATSPNGA